MPVPDIQILNACIPILQNVHEHEHGNREQRFITAYQIWLLLREEDNPICSVLLSEYGDAVGEGGGDYVGPAQRIAQALGRSPERIETHYVDTRRLVFKPLDQNYFEPSGLDCGLFRLSL
jgi:hypothetical protein